MTLIIYLVLQKEVNYSIILENQSQSSSMKIDVYIFLFLIRVESHVRKNLTRQSFGWRPLQYM